MGGTGRGRWRIRTAGWRPGTHRLAMPAEATTPIFTHLRASVSPALFRRRSRRGSGVAVPASPARRQTHTVATEPGCISMPEQIAAMQVDASQQEHMVKMITELLEETVARGVPGGADTGRCGPRSYYFSACRSQRQIAGGCSSVSSACCFAVRSGSST